MASLGVKIKSRTTTRRFVVEIDANKFEKLAADFGFFNPEFLESIDRGEADYRAGRIKKIKSLKELRAC